MIWTYVFSAQNIIAGVWCWRLVRAQYKYTAFWSVCGNGWKSLCSEEHEVIIFSMFFRWWLMQQVDISHHAITAAQLEAKSRCTLVRVYLHTFDFNFASVLLKTQRVIFLLCTVDCTLYQQESNQAGGQACCFDRLKDTCGVMCLSPSHHRQKSSPLHLYQRWVFLLQRDEVWLNISVSACRECACNLYVNLIDFKHLKNWMS